VSLRGFVLGTIAVSVAFFCGLVLWPSIVMSSAVDQIAGEYEAAGFDVSDCKKRWRITTGTGAECLEKPIREIMRHGDLSADAELEAELREEMENRAHYSAEAPPLD
jgi:hypothetical protein